MPGRATHLPGMRHVRAKCRQLGCRNKLRYRFVERLAGAPLNLRPLCPKCIIRPGAMRLRGESVATSGNTSIQGES